MTNERLAEIRAVLNGDQSVNMDEALVVVSRAADDLLIEVDRLRAGIEALAEPGMWSALDARRDMLTALLNPTKGGNDE